MPRYPSGHFNYRARGTCRPERLIIRLMERQMRDKWNFLHHPLLKHQGESDKIYYNAP